MSRYIHFSNAEKETACQTDIAELIDTFDVPSSQYDSIS